MNLSIPRDELTRWKVLAFFWLIASLALVVVGQYSYGKAIECEAWGWTIHGLVNHSLVVMPSSYTCYPNAIPNYSIPYGLNTGGR